MGDSKEQDSGGLKLPKPQAKESYEKSNPRQQISQRTAKALQAVYVELGATKRALSNDELLAAASHADLATGKCQHLVDCLWPHYHSAPKETKEQPPPLVIGGASKVWDAAALIGALLLAGAITIGGAIGVLIGWLARGG